MQINLPPKGELTMSAEKNLTKLIKSMSPELLGEEYVFCTIADDRHIDLNTLIIKGYFQEAEGKTLILTLTQARKLQFNCDILMKCITLKVHSSLEAVGLTAAISTTLAECNISANVVAGYYHDHVFVPSADANKACLLLKELSERK
jgi:hypothetical protein